MLAQRTAAATAFTRRDAVRLVVAVSLLVAALTAILSIDLLPQAAFRATSATSLRPTSTRRAPASTPAWSPPLHAREEARRKVEFAYDYSPTAGQLSAAQQLAVFERTVAPVDAAFGAVLSDEARQAALSTAVEGLSPQATTTLQGLDKASWTALRTELERVLDAAQRQEVRDTDLPAARAALASRASLSFPEDQRSLAGAILQPLLVANSSYDAVATEQAREQAAAAVEPVAVDIKQGELIVQAGARLTEADLEKLDALGVLDAEPDRIRIGGWFLLAVLTVALFLGWVWRFRPGLLAPQQRAAADRPLPRRGDARPEAHRGPLDPALLRSPGRGGTAHHDPARRRGGGRPDRDHRRARLRRRGLASSWASTSSSADWRASWRSAAVSGCSSSRRRRC